MNMVRHNAFGLGSLKDEVDQAIAERQARLAAPNL